tara:strand:- start:987 stop:2903 length:1917 start_codon:yes stop_codon:yes gene_type:complete
MNFKYRPEIDGLRAIAVLSVLIYHADFKIKIAEKTFNFLPGGYLGVDIFYVISGYLITFLIFDQTKKKLFNFKQFYERRARRLLPMLFLVIFTSLVAGWILMMPQQLKDLSGSALSSLIFLSNFWFLITDNYFADTSSLKPLLHTWSLSIEEQFYIFFPIIFYLLYKKKSKNIKLIFSILIIFSLLLASLSSKYYPNINFYILPTRIWELLIGSFLAYYHISNKIFKKIKFQDYLTFIGMALILVPFFLFNDKTPHPSFLTIFTILGCAFIIINHNSENIIKKILSSKIFVGVGLISYSLYLWHFPIFAFKKIKSKNLSEFDKLEGIILAIILSVFSYFLIEKPFRNKKWISKKKFLIFILSFFVILFISCLYIFNQKGLPQRYPQEVLKIIDFNYNYSEAYQTGKCHIKNINYLNKNIFENCKTKVNSNKKDLLLWGDSLAAHLYPGINNKYKDNYNIWHRSINDCKPVMLNLFQENKKKTESPCQKINQIILEEIIRIKPAKLFISGFWYSEDLKKLKKLINNLNTNGIKNIYLVGPSVRWHDPLPKILLKKYRISKKIPEYLSDKNHIYSFKLDDEFSNFSKQHSIKYISLIKILCIKDYKCLTRVGKEPDSMTNWDENHFTKKASIYVFSKFID